MKKIILAISLGLAFSASAQKYLSPNIWTNLTLPSSMLLGVTTNLATTATLTVNPGYGFSLQATLSNTNTSTAYPIATFNIARSIDGTNYESVTNAIPITLIGVAGGSVINTNIYCTNIAASFFKVSS